MKIRDVSHQIVQFLIFFPHTALIKEQSGGKTSFSYLIHFLFLTWTVCLISSALFLLYIFTIMANPHLSKQSKSIFYKVYNYLIELVANNPNATIRDFFKNSDVTGQTCGIHSCTMQRICSKTILWLHKLLSKEKCIVFVKKNILVLLFILMKHGSTKINWETMFGKIPRAKVDLKFL